MKPFIRFLLVLFCAGISVASWSSQPFVKLIEPVGPGSYVRVQVAKTDDAGNLIVAGVLYGGARFTPSLSIQGANKMETVFVAIQDVNGGWVAAKTLANEAEKEYHVRDLAVSDTMICVVGVEESSLPAAGFVITQARENLTGLGATPIVKRFYASDQTRNCIVTSVHLGTSNVVHMGGHFAGFLHAEGDGNTTILGIPPATGAVPDQDIFVCQLKSDLSIEWGARAGSSNQGLGSGFAAKNNGNSESLEGLHVDAAGNVFVVLNVTGMAIQGGVSRPVLFMDAGKNTFANFSITTGPMIGADSQRTGALMPVAAKLSSTGAWLGASSLEPAISVGASPHSFNVTYNAPATDMVISGGKMYVAGIRDTSLVGNYVYLVRVGLDTLAADGPVVYLTSPAIQTDQTESRQLAAEGNRVLLTGTMGRTLRVFRVNKSDTTLGSVVDDTTTVADNSFLAAFDTDLNFQWTRTSARPDDVLPPNTFNAPVVAYDSFRRAVYWGGDFRNTGIDPFQKLLLGDDDNPGAYGPTDRLTGWIAGLKENGSFRQLVRVAVRSSFGPIHINGTALPAPSVENTYLAGTTLSISVPAQFPTNQTSDTATRQRCTGFRVDGTVVSGDANLYTFQLQDDVLVTFGWQTEHRLHVTSDHAEAGLGETAAAGLAEPAIGDTWIQDGTLVNMFVDGVVLPIDATQFGTRYVVTGYSSTGAASSGRSFAQVVTRQQVPQFIMTNAATVNYHWKKQHRIQVSTTSEAAFSLPIARQLDSQGTELARGTGSGEFWFDHGSRVEVGAQVEDVSIQKSLKGWRNADPVPFYFPMIEFIAPTDATPDVDQLQARLTATNIDSKTYLVRPATNFIASSRITWDYGDSVYPVYTAIGDSIQLPQAAGIQPATPFQTVRVVDGPPGSTSSDMLLWDPVGLKAYPLRPGIILVDWINGSGQKVVLQVFAGFPGDRHPGVTPLDVTSRFPGNSHYRFIANTGSDSTPSVNLDPSASDPWFFREIKYATSDGSAVGGRFSSHTPGKSVLLFSVSPNNTPAIGNTNAETLLVRVVETRLWNDARHWDGPEVGAMLQPGGTALVGSPLSSAFDTAGIQTGYLIHPNANYNAELYQRELVRGPIIPVNVPMIDPSPSRQLIVVWYERRNGILWPYQPQQFTSFRWPDAPVSTVVGEGDLRRIVIASRIGSEGLDAAGNEQPVFRPANYSDVKIYNQPDRDLPGYNPNEEHARLFPSLLFASEGAPPVAAYALRNDLNISKQLVELDPADNLTPENHTSDPYVLVQCTDRATGVPRMFVYAVQREDESTRDVRLTGLPGAATTSYVFRYSTTAGKLITAPYPLNLVAGLDPCVNIIPDLFSNIDQTPNGSYFEDGDSSQRTWFVDHKGTAWAVSGGSHLFARYFYRLAPDFWYPFNLDAHDRIIADGACIPFLPAFRPLILERGVFDSQAAVQWRPVAVRYDTVWPEETPVLKLGESLTYPGGEYFDDNPNAPGLPGVLGWAAGEVVFDSADPARTDPVSNFAARLVSPLDERPTALATQSLPDKLKAGSPVVRIDGDSWYFTELSPSLQKRVVFRPLMRLNAQDAPGVLALRGFVNDRTLGAPDLTASPPPLYVMEPNILTAGEKDALLAIGAGNSAWNAAVNRLFAISRNPADLDLNNDSATDIAWLAGLRRAPRVSPQGDPLPPDRHRAVPFRGRGPGLAIVTNPRFLRSDEPPRDYYVTLAENNDPILGAAPVSLHVIRISTAHRYRGAIKTILPPNVFDEKITLRHSADFGGNVDQVAYSWWYHEEDGTVKTGDVPPGIAPRPIWNAFGVASGTAALNQIDLQSNPSLLLADNLFFVRYRHIEAAHEVEASWSTWAGAANSSIRDLDFDNRPDLRGQLATGWVKRVLDGINPYEARIREFTRNDSPSTASGIIQQLGAPFTGPVALNADKNVVENLGLIELYETVLRRARELSIDLDQPVATPGIQAALLLAGTRLADFYAILGNEAWNDALDPTIGIGDQVVQPASIHSSRFCFQDQLPSLLDEELGLLRGWDGSFGRPVYNRLFWNFTKGDGEVAYALNYNITDVNNDGVVDESDALRLYPQGHGDAWGHYLSSMRKRYDLLRHPLFNWDARGEFYNLLDVVIDVDYSDERKFAETAAIRAQVGAEIVASTYRSRYVEDTESRWQGARDEVPERAWGVSEWARRAGQAALFDWITANALVPQAARHTTAVHQRRLDRRNLPEIALISGHFADIQGTLDSFNNGLNPIGLDPNVLPFDLDPTHIDVGSTAQIGRQAVQGLTHFEQLFERAFASLKNAREAFEFANSQKAQLRGVATSSDEMRREALAGDLDYRNRLIGIFGTPYQGTIGPGKPYPAGYTGPDLNLFMYVDVNNLTAETVPEAAGSYRTAFISYYSMTNDLPEAFRGDASKYYLKDKGVIDGSASAHANVVLLDDSVIRLRLPVLAEDYTFVAPREWGERAAPGRLQSIVSEMMQVHAALSFAIGNYDLLHKQIRDRIEILKVKSDLKNRELKLKRDDWIAFTSTKSIIAGLNIAKGLTEFAAEEVREFAEDLGVALPEVNGVANDVTAPLRFTVRSVGGRAASALAIQKFIFEQAGGVLDVGLTSAEKAHQIEFDKGEFSGEVVERLAEIEEMLFNEGTTRIEVFRIQEQYRALVDQYRSILQEGLRLLEERRNFNVRLAAATQSHRYNDVFLRHARFESLRRYRDAFDIAARYCYMSAKAYDYETNFDPSDRGSAIPLLAAIARERSLGELGDNQPLNRGGLAGLMARLHDNFRAVEGRLGFNNLQLDHSDFSLRNEFMRVSEDADWRSRLVEARVANLWEIPEYRRFCRPTAAPGTAQPGIVLRFSTQVRSGLNFFGQPLGPGDSSFDPSVYATKIRSAGIRFVDYPANQLARTPLVYLIPAGFDVMTIPDSPVLQTRVWNVLDQAIPVPHLIGQVDLGRANWMPIIEMLGSSAGQVRRFSAFRAAVTDDDPSLNATRFIGRSVWNTQWLVIIPGSALHANPSEGIEKFIQQVQDIRIAMETYGYSGN